jgi:hypothetical protein
LFGCPGPRRIEAALQLFARGLNLDLKGINSIAIPNITSWPPQPVLVAEGAAGPNVQWGFGAAVIGPARKILVMAATTGELENATPETASAVIGRVLADASNKSIDLVAFGSAAADDTQPAGLLRCCTDRRCSRWTRCNGRGPRCADRRDWRGWH